MTRPYFHKRNIVISIISAKIGRNCFIVIGSEDGINPSGYFTVRCNEPPAAVGILKHMKQYLTPNKVILPVRIVLVVIIAEHIVVVISKIGRVLILPESILPSCKYAIVCVSHTLFLTRCECGNSYSGH